MSISTSISIFIDLYMYTFESIVYRIDTMVEKPTLHELDLLKKVTTVSESPSTKMEWRTIPKLLSHYFNKSSLRNMFYFLPFIHLLSFRLIIFSPMTWSYLGRLTSPQICPETQEVLPDARTHVPRGPWVGHCLSGWREGRHNRSYGCGARSGWTMLLMSK